MRIHPDKQWAIDFLLLPILANCLTDREDVPFVERLVEGGAAVSRSAEGYTLFGREGSGTSV